jgi:hypothetical protein
VFLQVEFLKYHTKLINCTKQQNIFFKYNFGCIFAMFLQGLFIISAKKADLEFSL